MFAIETCLVWFLLARVQSILQQSIVHLTWIIHLPVWMEREWDRSSFKMHVTFLSSVCVCVLCLKAIYLKSHDLRFSFRMPLPLHQPAHLSLVFVNYQEIYNFEINIVHVIEYVYHTLHNKHFFEVKCFAT
jgi:hypothetical protein